MGTIQDGNYISQYTGDQIDEALGKALNPDTAPTANSANLITSGGVYAGLQRKSNPNLLDNWYFVGGGSQQGGGQFPINQRGGMIAPATAPYYTDPTFSTQVGLLENPVTVVSYAGTWAEIKLEGVSYYCYLPHCIPGYVGAGYGIDRWFFSPDSGNGALSIQGDAVRITQGTTPDPATSISQSIENMQKLAGKTVTASMLVKTNVGYSQLLFLLNGTITGLATKDAQSGYTLISSTITLPDTLSGLALFFYGSTSAGNGNYGDIKAVKLELGDTQTLAHQENGVWVLNEIPNYQEQLARCQRYQLAIRLPNQTYSHLGLGVGRTTSDVFVCIPTPVTMRTIPTITINGTVTMRSKGVYLNSSTTGEVTVSNNCVMVGIMQNEEIAGEVYDVYLASPSQIIFDANL